MIDRKIEDNALRCPFCDRLLGSPEEISCRFGSSFEGGRCDCGAIYIYDRGGHSLGDAYVDALGLLCDDDWDRAWSLVPGEDYDVIERGYDSRRKKFGGEPRRRSNSPVLLFLRLKKKDSPDDPA